MFTTRLKTCFIIALPLVSLCSVNVNANPRKLPYNGHMYSESRIINKPELKPVLQNYKEGESVVVWYKRNWRRATIIGHDNNKYEVLVDGRKKQFTTDKMAEDCMDEKKNHKLKNLLMKNKFPKHSLLWTEVLVLKNKKWYRALLRRVRRRQITIIFKHEMSYFPLYSIKRNELAIDCSIKNPTRRFTLFKKDVSDMPKELLDRDTRRIKYPQ